MYEVIDIDMVIVFKSKPGIDMPPCDCDRFVQD